MAGVHSFKEYVSKKFDDKFWSIAEEFVDEHSDDLESLGVELRNVHRAGELEIQNVRVEHVWAIDRPGSEVGFDVALSVEFIVNEGDYHYDDYDEYTIWLMLSCVGDIDQRLDDCLINEVSLYSKRNRTQSELDDSLVPYIAYENLEAVAHKFLEEFYPEALRKTPFGQPPVLVDPQVLAERLDLQVEIRHIKENSSVFGQLFFESAETMLYNAKTEKEEPHRINAGTILVEPNLFFLRNLGSVNNTIVHECVHWVKHKKAFALAKLYNSDISSISCEIVGGASSPVSKTATEFMEKQANQLAPRIQMPAAPFKAKAKEYIAQFMRELDAKHAVDVMEKVIIQLEMTFGVSRQAAKIRLVELGFEEAIGTYNYVDGHYVKPHGFKKGSVKINQTFTIGAQDAAIERAINPELKEKTSNGDYLFIDNHFVYNAPLYVQTGVSGNLELTDYARTHMDECCLLFDMRITSSIGAVYHTACFLNREQSHVTFEIKFHNGYENAPKERQVELRKRQQEEWMNIRRQMTDDPEQCMTLLLQWRELSYKGLGEIISRNPETISRTVKGQTKPNHKTAALICFGLNLPPEISKKLLQVLNCTLNPLDPEHQWIQEALTLLYPEPINNIKSYLLQFGVEL